MGLLADLRIGTYGIQFIPPPFWRLEVDRDICAAFRDDTHRVGWSLEFSSLIVDLSIEHEEVLRDDLRHDITAVFDSFLMSSESHERASDALSGPERIAPFDATADVAPSPSFSWSKRDLTCSPLVSIERVWIGGAPALVVIHRVPDRAGNAVIIGRILIPLEQGTVYMSAMERVETTRVREAVRAMTSLVPARDCVAEVVQSSQAMIDDPPRDEHSPDHPLTAIRRALQWALTTPLKMTVRAPLSPKWETPLVLPRSGCSIHPPPRFRFSPALAAGMNQSLTPFVRATVPLSSSYTFDVWRLPSVSIKGRQLVRQLHLVAEEHVRRWMGLGDATLECAEFSMRDGLPGVSTCLCFHAEGTRNHAVANWFTDHDGTVFRVCAGGTVARSREERTKVVNDSTATWTRLPEGHPPRSIWWNLFSS